MRLNVGSGKKSYKDFANLDINAHPNVDFVCEAWDTSFEDNSIKGIYCRQVLEHFTTKNLEKTLTEWKRILKSGSLIHVEVPDLLFACAQISKKGKSPFLKHTSNFTHAYHSIFGWSIDEMEHKQGFTAKILKNLFINFGFVDVKILKGRVCDLILEAKQS